MNYRSIKGEILHTLNQTTLYLLKEIAYLFEPAFAVMVEVDAGGQVRPPCHEQHSNTEG